MYFGVPPGPFTAFPHQKAFHQGAGGRVFRYYALVYPVEYTLRYSTG